jgi:hypothetical protein
MGNLVDTLIKYIFNRRQNGNNASRTRPDHPERLPPDQLPTAGDTEQNLSLPSTPVTTTEAVVITVTTTEVRSSLELTTKISTEVDSITIEAASSTIIDSRVLSNKCSNFYLACRYNNIEEVKNYLKR